MAARLAKLDSPQLIFAILVYGESDSNIKYPLRGTFGESLDQPSCAVKIQLPP
jgi:hypothetical protein